VHARREKLTAARLMGCSAMPQVAVRCYNGVIPMSDELESVENLSAPLEPPAPPPPSLVRSADDLAAHLRQNLLYLQRMQRQLRSRQASVEEARTSIRRTREHLAGERQQLQTERDALQEERSRRTSARRWRRSRRGGARPSARHTCRRHSLRPRFRP
jgi:hypothetical protein